MIQKGGRGAPASPNPRPETDMTDFSHCPACGEDWDPKCGACAGTARRPLSRESFELAVSAREWADEQVRDLFQEWCELTGYDLAYGVESWQVYGDSLLITQDRSCRGCYNSERHDLPLAWLYASGDERADLILAHAREQDRIRQEQEAVRRQREAASLRARLAAIEAAP